MVTKRRGLISFIIIGYILFCVTSYVFFSISTLLYSSLSYNDVEITRRKLLTFEDNPALNDSTERSAKVNCTPPDIEQFPRTPIGYETRRQGALLVHILISLYMFLGLAIICDEYFVPSLEILCKVLKIRSDVAGATFMAAGSSAPELATAVIAVFIAKDDIGIGTVVGSAVFNIAFVIGICGLFAGRVVFLNWWPMFRDCLFYLISILALLFALYDERVSWFESALFLILYVLYTLFMFVNQRVENWITKLQCVSCVNNSDNDVTNNVSYHPLPDVSYNVLENVSSEKSSNNSEFYLTTESSLSTPEEEKSVFSLPSGCMPKIIWMLSLPYLSFCYITIPDCRKKRWEKCFFMTFVCSCIWIGVLSYILVWMITIIGFTLHIKDTIMGLTFLAAGASIPDAISSLLVIKDGYGDMAVSNAVGSNVFDILMCLGLPWFLKTVVIDPGSTIIVRSKGLIYSTLTLLLTVVFLLVATHLNKWKLDKKYGAILLGWYALFMVVATVYELDIFGGGSIPTCSSDF